MCVYVNAEKQKKAAGIQNAIDKKYHSQIEQKLLNKTFQKIKYS